MENLNIVYADNILPFDETNNSKCVTSLAGISEWEFEECIKKIMKDNPDAGFNVIQFSREDNRVYFYTDNPVMITYEPNKEYQISMFDNDLTEVIDDVLKYEDDLNERLVSIYNLLTITKKMKEKHERTIKELKADIDMEMSRKFDPYYSFKIGEVNYLDGTMTMLIKQTKKSEPVEVVFAKVKGELKVISSQLDSSPKLERVCSNSLTAYYDYFMDKKGYKTERVVGAQTQEKLFRCNITNQGVRVYSENNVDIIALNSSMDCKVHTTNNELREKLQGKEKELLSKLYVMIDRLPMWLKEAALDARKEYVKEEIRKMKINQFWNKVFKSNKKDKSKKQK